MKNYLLILLALLFTNCSQSVQSVSPAETAKTAPTPVVQTKIETDEAKAVRLAEEFTKINGYTEAPADKEHLTLESLEWESDTDKMLADRKNSLEPKAYGISPGGKGTGKGWTVVFRHQFSQIDKKQNLKTGRAVTMDENFQDLKMAHEEFILARVQKKL